MNSNRSFSPSTRHRAKTVPVNIDAYNTGLIPIDSIRGWQDAHGTTRDGKTINSGRFAKVGGTAVIQGADGHTLSMPLGDTEMLAVALAESFGYNVTALKA
ncbi:hypothetical protein HYS79_01340 [Patescibacteria group bacterium]|nr:hypothetical protein [Patescibacteria group bacterium]